MIQSLGFPKNLQQIFSKEAAGGGGDEVCAVLVGTSRNLSGIIEEVRMVKNIAPDKCAGFMMDPVDFLNAVEDTTLYERNASKEYIGIIHSHFYDRPYPSIADWAGANDGRLYHGAYVIYGVHHEQFLSYFWNGLEFRRMEILD